MLTRRAFLGNMAAGSLIASLSTVAEGNERQRVKSKADVVLYEGEYPGWPWITKGADGTLYCVFREGVRHMYSETGRVMFTRSADRGRSWSKPDVIMDMPLVDDRNTAIVETADKVLLVCFNTYTAKDESAVMVIQSPDGGKTWTPPTPIDIPNSRTRSAAIVLKNGDLLLPYYIAPGNGSMAGLSKDKGKTWESVRVPDTEGFLGDEWDVLEVEPGRIIGIHRNNQQGSDGTFWRSESRDNGRTWTVPQPTNVQSKRASSPPQISLHNNIPVLIYADRRMVSVSAVTTSDPGYLKWNVEDKLNCYFYNADESPIQDGSYPCSVQTGPNERLVVDYEIRDNVKRIAGYFVDFPENWGIVR